MYHYVCRRCGQLIAEGDLCTECEKQLLHSSGRNLEIRSLILRSLRRLGVDLDQAARLEAGELADEIEHLF